MAQASGGSDAVAMAAASAPPTAAKLARERWDAAVVGAGIHGLCTAFWLVQSGVRRLVVLEEHFPGHTLGSSHGGTRITRSTYHDPEFVALAAEAHQRGWPALEQALAQPLRVATPGVFHGPAEGPFASYLAAAAHAEGQLEPLTARAAAQRFPLLRFAPGDAVLLDHSAAVLLAARIMAALRSWLAASGVQFAWGQRVVAIEADPSGHRLQLAEHALQAAAVVVAAGPDLARLVPELSPPLQVVPQQVGYFALEAAPELQAPGAFPVWAHIAAGENGFTYGLPAVDGAAPKAAIHRTTVIPSTQVDPSAIDRAALLALGRERFAAPVLGLAAAESCRYTMTPEQRFTVARAARPGLVAIAGCSGHGFKFGPVLGARAAALLRT